MNPSALTSAALDHWSRADEFLQDSRDLLAAAKAGWAMTAIFYSALHRVDTCLVELGHKPRNHSQREALVTRHLPDIADAYKDLKVRSERGRYEPTIRIAASEVESALSNEYAAIQTEVTARLP